MVVFAVLVAVQWDPGLADFLFWLTATWMALARYVEIGRIDKEPRRLPPKAIRDWCRYSIMSLLFAGLLYALARFIAHKGLI